MTFDQAVRWHTLGAVRLLILRLGRWLAAGNVIIPDLHHDWTNAFHWFAGIEIS